MNKKDLQNTVKAIRESEPAQALRQISGYDSRKQYPKAMMTATQAAKNIATVNCGGGFHHNAKAEALMVLENEQFLELLARHNATAQLDGSKREYGTPYFQVLIKW